MGGWGWWGRTGLPQELWQRESKPKWVSPSSPHSPSCQLRLCCSRAHRVNTHFFQGTERAEPQLGELRFARCVWESKSPAHRCRELLLYNQCIIH